MEDPAKTLHRQQMAQYAAAVAIQLRKRGPKKPLEETPTEIFNRVSQETTVKEIRTAKSAAKAAVKNKKMKTIASYFGPK